MSDSNIVLLWKKLTDVPMELKKVAGPGGGSAGGPGGPTWIMWGLIALAVYLVWKLAA
jgi:hypothetical protein